MNECYVADRFSRRIQPAIAERAGAVCRSDSAAAGRRIDLARGRERAADLPFHRPARVLDPGLPERGWMGVAPRRAFGHFSGHAQRRRASPPAQPRHDDLAVAIAPDLRRKTRATRSDADSLSRGCDRRHLATLLGILSRSDGEKESEPGRRAADFARSEAD